LDTRQKGGPSIAAMTTNPYTEPRAHALRDRYHALFQAPELPVPVEAIAEDLLGLHVEEAPLDGISGLLYPAVREIVLNADEPPVRRRFTLAHELGHWICQCLEGTEKPVFCRVEEVGADPAAKKLERQANIFAAELLMPEPAVRAAWGGALDVTARLLEVSEEAIAWRLYNLGLTGERPR
jgi:Zn-dependent peptidase ImmA (M78 family)